MNINFDFHIIRCSAYKSCTVEFVLEVTSYSSGEVPLYFCVILEMSGGIFLRPLWNLIYCCYYNTQLSVRELPFSNKKAYTYFWWNRITRHSFHVSIVSRVNIVFSFHPPSPAIPNNLSFLQLKDTCFLFPTPFSHLGGRTRRSKVVLGLLVIYQLIWCVLSHQGAVRWLIVEETIKMVWQGLYSLVSCAEMPRRKYRAFRQSLTSEQKEKVIFKISWAIASSIILQFSPTTGAKHQRFQ